MDNEYLNGYAKIFGAVGTAIYVSLCRHADSKTQKCFPSMELIGEELNISRNTISKYIKLFEKNRLIATEREKDDETKQWKSTIYYLLDKTEWLPHAQQMGVEFHAQPLTEPCSTIDKSHAQPLGNKDTHSINTNITILIPFNDFKKAYPRKTRMKDAEKIWNRLSLEVQQTILKDIPIRIKGRQWNEDNGKYILYPTTYLNGERWNDEIEQVEIKNKVIHVHE